MDKKINIYDELGAVNNSFSIEYVNKIRYEILKPWRNFRIL